MLTEPARLMEIAHSCEIVFKDTVKFDMQIILRALNHVLCQDPQESWASIQPRSMVFH